MDKQEQQLKQTAVTLIKKGSSYSILYGNKDLYPDAEPLESAIRKSQALDDEAATLFLICSPLLGYGLSELADTIQSQNRYILLECIPELAELKLFSEAVFPKNLDDYMFMDIPSENQELLESYWLRQQNRLEPIFRKTRKLRLVSLNAGRMLASKTYAQCQIILEALLQRYWRNRSTLQYHGRSWVRNLVSNLGQYPALIPDRMKTKVDVLIFAAAGPSLEQILPQLLKHRESLFIICADTALPSLIQNDINPDVCIVLEAQWHNLDDFTYAKLPKTIQIWADLSAHPATLRFLHRQGLEIFLFQSLFVHSKTYQDLGSKAGFMQLPPLGSVGVSGLYLSLKCDAQQYALIGTDYCNSALKSHARSSPSYMRGLRTCTRVKPHPFIKVMQPYHESVLASYGDLAKAIIKDFSASHKQKIYDLRQDGLDLGLQKTSIENLVQKKNSEPSHLTYKLDSSQQKGKESVEFLEKQITTIISRFFLSSH